MPFFVRYTDNSGTHTTELHPRPTAVSYPERRLFKRRDTKDGSSVISRPIADSRPRQWIWKAYRAWQVEFNNQWALLVSLETKARLQNGLSATVQIWENETTEGGFGDTTGGAPDVLTYSNLKWTTVKVIQVDRKLRDNGGPVTYDTSTFEFCIEDSNYTSF